VGELQHSQKVTATLDRLREAANLVGNGWSPERWQWTRPDGSVHEVAGFADLDFAAHARQVLRCSLDLPERAHGVDLTGDRLQLKVESIFPIKVSLDDEVLVSEGLPTVATGPVLVDAIDALAPGSNGSVEVEITRPPTQGAGEVWAKWVGVEFWTPGLRERFDLFDLAWAQLRLAQEVATTPEDVAIVEHAAGLVPEDVAELDQPRLRDALTAMADALEPFAHRVAQTSVHIIGHCHIDLAWLWTWDETREVIKRDIRSVLAIMRDYPEVTFTHSQPAGYEVIRRDEPEMFTEIARHVAEGRWEAATTQWVEGDTNLASGEAMASQLLEGVTFTREHLHTSPTVFHAPDTFGHAANLPQLVTDAGVQVYYHHRGNPGDWRGRWPAYWWEGLDGTRVLATSTITYNGTLTAQAIAEATVEAIRAGLPAGLLFVGVGDHGGGPTREGYDRLRRVRSAAGMPTSFCSTLAGFAEEIVASGAPLPVHRGESPTIFEGCYTTHADAKRVNRDGENRLVTAETLSALAGLERDATLTEAWRDLCFNQFHDILPGSAIHEVYEQTHRDYERLVATTDRAVDAALEVLHRGSPGTVAVTNPAGHDRTELVIVDDLDGLDVADGGSVAVIDADGRRTSGQITEAGLVFVAAVPAFGTAHYTIASASPDESIAEGVLTVRPDGGTADEPRYWRVETTHFAVAVRSDNGILTSFVDKRADRELVAFGMQRMSDYIDSARPDLGLNVFQIVDELPHGLSAWQYTEVGSEQNLIAGATTELVEDGPVRVVLRVRHTVRSSTITEDIVFYRDLPRVDFVARVDWQEPGGHEHGVPNLKVSFTPDLDECDAWFEVPYGAVRRRSNGQQVPALRWADVGGSDYGVAVLNDSIYGHDVLGNRMRLSLLRTAYAPDPRTDQGSYEFRFALVPHVGDWRQAGIPHQAASLNQPLLARRVPAATNPTAPAVTNPTAPAATDATTTGAAAAGAAAPWSPQVDTEDGIVTTDLRVARDGSGTVIRLSEGAGRPTPVRVNGLPADATVWRADLTERRSTVAGTGPELSFTLSPWEVRTLIVDDAR
jgi:alpha-mannosidase